MENGATEVNYRKWPSLTSWVDLRRDRHLLVDGLMTHYLRETIVDKESMVRVHSDT